MSLLVKSVLSEFEEVLKAQGFRKVGTRFFHEEPGAIRWIEVLKSKASTDERFKFTLNLGAFLPELARAIGDEIRDVEIMNGHWRVRLGHLMPSPDDRWWEVSSVEEAAAVGQEVVDLLKQYGLPALRKAGTIHGLIRFYETGPGAVYAGARRLEVTDALKQLANDGKGAPLCHRAPQLRPP